MDLVFYEGHGNPSLFTFKTPWGNGTHDDSYLTYNDAYRAWGDRDLEWIALLSCSVLADSHEGNWANAFDYLHLMLGFRTTAYDVKNFGSYFAWYIEPPWPFSRYNLTSAWFKACDKKQPGGVQAKVLAEEYHHFFDTTRYQYPDHYPDATYWWWRHTCGCEPARQVDLQQIGDTMPVFQTPPLSLEEQQSEWNTLTSGNAFDMPKEGTHLLQDTSVSVSEGRELEMDDDSGLFYYVDHNNYVTMTSLSRVRLLTAADAKDIADDFLNTAGLMPEDAEFYEVAEDLLAGGSTPARALAAGLSLDAVQVQTETVTAYQVIYSRILTYTPPGLQQTVEFSVVGPGAKLKIGVDPSATGAYVATKAQPDGAVIAAQGGWRRLQETGGLEVLAEVPILSYEQVEQLFLQLEPQVALEQVPFDNPTSKEVLTYTMGYWEEPAGTGQSQLYPAFVLSATYASETIVVTDYTYIPASALYMRPLAVVASHSDTSGNIKPGTVFTATAADASSTLAELGYHESLTFTVGSGVGPYTYAWYLGSVDDANRIGVGQTLTYTVSAAGGAGKESVQPQYVILEVTDVGSVLGEEATSKALTQLDVVAPIFLPLNMKG